MFKIDDGRTCFFQWDKDRKLIVEDSSIPEVHFCNRTSDCSLVCETFTEGGVTYVNVPNVLLQNEFKLRVYAYNRDYTKFEEDFKIIPRTKPADYVYTPTEIKSFDDLEERVEALETEGVPQETIDKRIEEYLNTHELPTGATEEQVKQIEANTAAITQAQSDIDALEAAANNYALKTEIPTVPTKVSAFENDKGYLTEHQDLSDYAKKTEIPSIEGLATESYVDTAIGAITIPDVSNFTTMAAVEAKGYQTESQVNALINTALGAISDAEDGTY